MWVSVTDGGPTITQRVQADIDPMSLKGWSSVTRGGQYSDIGKVSACTLRQQVIEPKDDLVTVDIKNVFHHISDHRNHLITLITKTIDTTSISYQPLWLCSWRRDISSFLFTKTGISQFIKENDINRRKTNMDAKNSKAR